MSQLKPSQILPFVPPSGPKIPPDMRESIPLTEASDRLVEQGVAMAHAGRRDDALHVIDQALLINGKNVEALLWRGALSPADVALSFLDRALALDPTSQRARQGVAWARQRMGLSAAVAQPQAPVSPAGAAAGPEPAPPSASGPAASGKRAQPAAAHDTMPMQWPDVAGAIKRLLSILVDRPMMALVVAVVLMGLLATAAVARAGMSRSDMPPETPRAGAKSASAPLVSGLPSPVAGAASDSALTATVNTARLIAPTPTPPLVISVAAFEQSWANSEWDRVIPVGEELMKRNPGDDNLAKRMVTAYYKYSVQLIRADRLAEGVALLDKALQIDANNVDVRDERRYAKLDLDGTTGLSEGDWVTAITNLRMLYDMHPTYRSVASKLYQAYIGQGDTLEKEGKKTDAYVSYQKAWRIDTKGTEANAGLTRLQGSAPQTVINAAGKKIEVDIAKQQVIVYQNNTVLWRFKASTGKAPYLTRRGNFEILNHMPHAYSSALGWNMPFWMGIYQAGGTENGFHGMAILGNGKEVSTSVLGRTATSGCIMLSNPDASALYNWAPVGDPVSY